MEIQSLEPEFAGKPSGRNYPLFLRPTSKALIQKPSAKAVATSVEPSFNAEHQRVTKKSRVSPPSQFKFQLHHEHGWLGLPDHEPGAPQQGETPTEIEPAGTLKWWLSKAKSLPAERRNGWVVARMLEEYSQEQEIATVCGMETFQQRMERSGLRDICESRTTPRARCDILRRAAAEKQQLLDESAQRSMIKAIDRSIPSYISGVRCWAAFCDAQGVVTHFPATEVLALRYTAVFGSHATLCQYLKHLRWAHRFLHYSNAWETPAVRQAISGVRKSGCGPRVKLALLSKQVASIVKTAEGSYEMQVAALAAISRLFLLRVPSEAIPLQWDGEHSRIQLAGTSASITLMRRKNLSTPSVLERRCCCESSGERLCAVHWLHRLHKLRRSDGRVFAISASVFLTKVREFAAECGVANAHRIGTHAFRRGMAQDIISAGGSLAVLLRAGEWHSRAFLKYLRESQPEDEAVAQVVINLSDSEVEA